MAVPSMGSGSYKWIINRDSTIANERLIQSSTHWGDEDNPGPRHGPITHLIEFNPDLPSDGFPPNTYSQEELQYIDTVDDAMRDLLTRTPPPSLEDPRTETIYGRGIYKYIDPNQSKKCLTQSNWVFLDLSQIVSFQPMLPSISNVQKFMNYESIMTNRLLKNLISSGGEC